MRDFNGCIPVCALNPLRRSGYRPSYPGFSGMDKEGTFNGRGAPTRAQAAIILARVLEPSLRVKTP